MHVYIQRLYILNKTKYGKQRKKNALINDAQSQAQKILKNGFEKTVYYHIIL